MKLTPAQQTARNAEIAKLREVDQWMWGRIAAHFDLTIKATRAGYDSLEIAVRQAIGDLPIRFKELRADRDWERTYEQVIEVLRRHNTPRHAGQTERSGSTPHAGNARPGRRQ